MEKIKNLFSKIPKAVKILIGIIFLIICAVLIVSWIGSIYFSGKNKSEEINQRISIDSETEKIGWITDIHADGIKQMDGGESGIIYTKKFKDYLPAFLDKMQKEQIKTVIITGDNVHYGNIKYVEKLKDIADKYKNLKILWAKGNRDRESTAVMENLGVTAPYYYVYDTEKIRMIILNLTDNKKPIDADQLKWFKNKLSETKLAVVVAMHSPIVDYDNNLIFPQFEELEGIMRESGRVKFVISGDLHLEKEVSFNGIFYKTAYPLTSKDHLGSYYVIDAENDKIESGNIEISEN